MQGRRAEEAYNQPGIGQEWVADLVEDESNVEITKR
jgi:hypothetical protein